MGIRKIARFGYENRANTFYDGTETSYSDAATIGKVRGLEFLFQGKLIKNLVEFVQINKKKIINKNNVSQITRSIADINHLNKYLGNFQFKS